MASHALALYMASCSTYNLDGVSASIDLVPESTFGREEAKAITAAPLAIIPPPSSGTSGGASLKSMARTRPPLGGAKVKKAPLKRTTTSAIGLKRKAPEDDGPRKRVPIALLGNVASHSSSSLPSAHPSPSYTVIGVRKPDGGYGKGLMPKPAPKGKEQVESLSQPLRIKRIVKPTTYQRPPAPFKSDEEEEAPPKIHHHLSQRKSC